MKSLNNNDNNKVVNDDVSTCITKKVIALEKYNCNQKEFSSQEMIKKIMAIIEREVNGYDNK